MKKARPIAVSVFSGVGGSCLGLESSGFDIAASIEIDPIHSLVHHFNFPNTINICRDVTQITGEQILNKIGKKEVDALIITCPCQSFSLAGQRRADDPRSNLIFETPRLLREMKPKYFIFENVPGLNMGESKKLLEQLIIEIEESGYSIVKPIKILDSSLYNVPQKRKRLILIGARNGLKLPEYPKPIELPNQSVGMAIEDLAKIPAFINEDFGLDIFNIDNYPGWSYPLCHIRNPNRKVFGHLGSKHNEKTIDRFANVKPGEKDKISRFTRLNPNGLCNTLRAGTGSNKGAFTAPRPIHYDRPRCITIREAARLHTFPDWFEFHRTIWNGFREIGNSVPPLLAKAIGDEIIKCLGVDTSQLRIIRWLPRSDGILKYNMSQAADFWNVPRDTIAKRTRKPAPH